MKPDILYQECPVCNQGAIVWNSTTGLYGCAHCGLQLKDRSVLGFFRKGHYGVAGLAQDDYLLAAPALTNISLPAAKLKVTLGSVYPDAALARIAAGEIDAIRPVRTVLAQIILEQLKETCYIQVQGLRLNIGPALTGNSSYRPNSFVPRQNLEWQGQGNLFGTARHLVLPGDTFTFIRFDRKLSGVQAFVDGVAVQRHGEKHATYFVGCYPHEAALIAAFVMGQTPALRAA